MPFSPNSVLRLNPRRRPPPVAHQRFKRVAPSTCTLPVRRAAAPCEAGAALPWSPITPGAPFSLSHAGVAFGGVQTPLNPPALPGRLDFLTSWHSRAPRNASWTDCPLRDRRSHRLWGNRNGPLAQRYWVAIRPVPTVPIRPRRARGIWFFLEAWAQDIPGEFVCPVEADETYSGSNSPCNSRHSLSSLCAACINVTSSAICCERLTSCARVRSSEISCSTTFVLSP